MKDACDVTYHPESLPWGSDLELSLELSVFSLKSCVGSDEIINIKILAVQILNFLLAHFFSLGKLFLKF